jgi:hypothetical protein
MWMRRHTTPFTSVEFSAYHEFKEPWILWTPEVASPGQEQRAVTNVVYVHSPLMTEIMPPGA